MRIWKENCQYLISEWSKPNVTRILYDECASQQLESAYQEVRAWEEGVSSLDSWMEETQRRLSSSPPTTSDVDRLKQAFQQAKASTPSESWKSVPPENQTKSSSHSITCGLLLLRTGEFWKNDLSIQQGRLRFFKLTSFGSPFLTFENQALIGKNNECT